MTGESEVVGFVLRAMTHDAGPARKQRPRAWVPRQARLAAMWPGHSLSALFPFLLWRPVMTDDAHSTKSLNNAADLAQRQLERAIQVARAASFESEPAVVAAILRAIVANHWKFLR